MKKLSLRLLIGLALAILSTGTANAQVLLTIDWSDTSAVTITATGNAASASYSDPSFTYLTGVSLRSFLTADFGQQDELEIAASTTLTDNGVGTFFYNDLFVDDFTPNTFIDLDIYNPAGAIGLPVFTSGQQAFTGSAVWDLSSGAYASLIALFPAFGATGDINAGDSDNQGSVIGTWEIVGATAVPEPSTYAVLFGIIALFGTVAVRRNRRQ